LSTRIMADAEAPLRIKTQARKSEGPEDNCAFCLEALGDGRHGELVLACGHLFHARCAAQFLLSEQRECVRACGFGGGDMLQAR